MGKSTSSSPVAVCHLSILLHDFNVCHVSQQTFPLYTISLIVCLFNSIHNNPQGLATATIRDGSEGGG